MMHLIPVPDTQTLEEAWADIVRYHTLATVADTVAWTEIDCADAPDCPYCHPEVPAESLPTAPPP